MIKLSRVGNELHRQLIGIGKKNTISCPWRMQSTWSRLIPIFIIWGKLFWQTSVCSLRRGHTIGFGARVSTPVQWQLLQLRCLRKVTPIFDHPLAGDCTVQPQRFCLYTQEKNNCFGWYCTCVLHAMKTNRTLGLASFQNRPVISHMINRNRLGKRATHLYIGISHQKKRKNGDYSHAAPFKMYKVGFHAFKSSPI